MSNKNESVFVLKFKEVPPNILVLYYENGQYNTYTSLSSNKILTD